VLPEAVQAHQCRLLELLQERLRLALIRIEDVEPNSKSSKKLSIRGIIWTWKDLPTFTKLKYAAYAKSRLEETLADLESWHQRFDLSWYLLILLPTKDDVSEQLDSRPQAPTPELEILKRLRRLHLANNELEQPDGADRSVFCSPSDIVSRRTRIFHTDAETAVHRDQVVIVDSRQIRRGGRPDSDSALAQGVLSDTRDIVKILQNVDSETFGLLPCKWARKIIDRQRDLVGVDLLFAIPDGYSSRGIKSLRGALLDGHAQQSLDARFKLARQLARSISFLRSAGIVHKNIRPETILLLLPYSSPASAAADTTIGTPFLVGFEKFRRAEVQTYMLEDSFWARELYRHPRRQGVCPEHRYRMQHDIYSLGVCLLEVGLGVSFVQFENEQAVPARTLSIAEHFKREGPKARAFEIKRVLEAAAETLLPERMGAVYTRLVLSCLTCLDPGNQYFGGEENFQDQDGILVAVRYIEKVRPLLYRRG
jgi:hypothetical protein